MSATSEKLSKVIGTIIGILLIPTLIFLGIKLQSRHEEKYPWRGSFYKIADEEQVLADSTEVATLDDCRQWVADTAEMYSLGEAEYDYSCGTGCTYQDDMIVSGKRIKTYECTELTK